MSFKTLRALHALMGSALDDMEHIYASAPEGPLDYPSLDEPFYKHCPPDDRKRVAAENLTTNKEVFAASATVVSACGKILATVNKPWFTMVENIYAMNIAACMQYVEKAHIIEILRDAGDAGLHVDDIARQIDAIRAGRMKDKTDVRGLTQILQLLAAYHWIKEVRPDAFANNRLSSYIDSGKSLGELHKSPDAKYDETNGIGAFCAITDDIVAAATRIPEFLLTAGHGFAGAERKPAPFNLSHDTPLGFYEWMEAPQNRGWKPSRFGHAMNGSRAWEELENMVDGFPWHTLPKDALVVDVGGGIGSVSMVLARAFPELRFVVQDRADVIGSARKSWGPAYAEIFDSGRITYQVKDFFEPQEPIEIKGVGTIEHADVYILRTIIHNWTDPDVKRILAALRKNAAQKTRLLIVDIVPAHACVDDEPAPVGVPVDRSLAPEGSPLLANLGRANVTGYLLDVSMLALYNARERTLRELTTLCLSVGWKLTSVHRATGSLWAYMIAEPV